MSFRRRACVVGLLFAVALAFYGVARLYSHSLVLYVVEQSLMQKAPPGTDLTLLRMRFQAQLAALPDRRAVLAKALALSQNLEKIQKLTPQELEELLPVTPETRGSGPS